MREKKGFSPVLFLLFILNYIKKCVWLRWRMRNTESGKKKPRNNDDDDDSEDDFYKNQNKKIHWNHPTLTEINQKWWLFILFFFRIIIGRYIVASLCVCVCVCKFWLKILHFFSKKSVTHIFFLDLLFWWLFSHFTIDNRSWNCFFFFTLIQFILQIIRLLLLLLLIYHRWNWWWKCSSVIIQYTCKQIEQ